MKTQWFYYSPDPQDAGSQPPSGDGTDNNSSDAGGNPPENSDTGTDDASTPGNNSGDDTSTDSSTDDASTAGNSSGENTSSDTSTGTDDASTAGGDPPSDTSTGTDDASTSGSDTSTDTSTGTDDASTSGNDTNTSDDTSTGTDDSSTSDSDSSEDTSSDSSSNTDDTAAGDNTSATGSQGDDSSGNTSGGQQAGTGGAADDGTKSSTASSATDTQYLFVDVYSQDLNGNPAWSVLVKTPRFNGAILKATQGTKGYSNDHGWFKKNWPLLKSVAGDRYGSTWFRGAYLFLNFWEDGASQADYYLDTITDAGGWDTGDMIPIIDVELGNDGKNGKPRNRNQDATAAQIIDCTTACAGRLKSVTGRKIMLYGRGAMRDKKIKSKMGCDIVWNPSYTATMVKNGLEAWTTDDVALWQYCGDGDAAIDEKKLPRSIPNFGKPDISVYVEGANKPSLDTLKERLGIGTA